MKNQLKNIFALLAFLFMTSGIQAMTVTHEHECKCPNKETCCVSKEHCAKCEHCKTCCKGEHQCSTAKADGDHAHACKGGSKDCCKDGKKGKKCSTEGGEKDCCKKDSKKKKADK